ncbi:MAG: DUF421 domain-containing protein [Clostridia bacterium]|nr:DUF421 domain-containing protein [Clostridia bacterium]
MLALIGKTVLFYIIINIAIRCMGKRQVGELSTSEIIVALLISEVAAAPIVDSAIPMKNGIVAVFVLVGMEVLYSYLSLKFPFFLILTQGKPTVIIENGKISEQALRKTRLTIAELNEELRIKNINLKDVYLAMIENNGQLSVIPTNESAGITRRDLGIRVDEYPQDFAVILDGRISEGNLKRIGKNKQFVAEYLKSKKVSSPKEVLVMYADPNGVTFFQKKGCFSKEKQKNCTKRQKKA